MTVARDGSGLHAAGPVVDALAARMTVWAEMLKSKRTTFLAVVFCASWPLRRRDEAEGEDSGRRAPGIMAGVTADGSRPCRFVFSNRARMRRARICDAGCLETAALRSFRHLSPGSGHHLDSVEDVSAPLEDGARHHDGKYPAHVLRSAGARDLSCCH